MPISRRSNSRSLEEFERNGIMSNLMKAANEVTKKAKQVTSSYIVVGDHMAREIEKTRKRNGGSN